MAYIGIILEIERSYNAALHAMKAYPENSIELVQVDTYEQGVLEAQRMVRSGIVALVTRAGYISQLRSANLSVPVIEIPFTISNVTQRCMDAYKQYGTIGVVGPQSMLEQASALDSVLGSAARYYLATTPADYRAAAAQAKLDGVRVLVGGYDETRYAESEGMARALVSSGEEELSEALREAMKIVTQIQAEAQKSEELKTLLDIIGDALLMFDNQGKLVQMNKKAHKILQDSAKIGQPLGEGQLKNSVESVLESGKSKNYDLLEYGGSKYMCDILRIGSGHKSGGAVAKLQSVEYVQSMEQSARARLAERGLTAAYSFSDIVGSSAKIQEAIHKAKRYSQTQSTILITGESGTGKELFAQGIHNYSPRAHGPFVAINCATLPESLLESELFGYSEGAFTGAKRGGKAGLFELAHNGTLFLDEVGEMDLSIQARLLRVMEDKRVMRIGDDKMIPINVRIIAATNKNLRKMVYEGKFREDLYYRLNVLGLILPAVREREQDLKLLIEHFIEKKAEKEGHRVPHLTDDAMQLLLSYHWPGNVREIANTAERLVVTSSHNTVDSSEIEELMYHALHTQPPKKSREIEAVVSGPGDDDIRDAMQRCGGNKSAAAAALGISRPTLYKRLREMDYE